MNTVAKSYPRVCYEIFVRSFCDSNGDGIGDLNGITSKLGYLSSLGVEAIWLTPFHPAPSYHKYDVKDYYAVDPEYGTLDDFKVLLARAREFNLAVYMDFVISHTSVEHPWFLEAKKGPDNPYRQYYLWMTPAAIAELGVVVRESTEDSDAVNPWHVNPGDEEKYYGLFSDTMADLNFDHPELRREINSIANFWLAEVGVDGFRIDAARHIYPHWVSHRNPAFWLEYDSQIREIRQEVYSVGEVWANAEEIAPYLKGLTATFNFELSNRLQKIIRTGRDNGLVERLLEIYVLYRSQNPEFIDSTMLTNHDQIRIGSVAEGDVRKMKLAAALLFTLPGQPYLYYGEEIGMLGDKPDPHIREPFLWSHISDDAELTRWIKPKYAKLRLITPLTLALSDSESLVNHYKRLIQLRKDEPALGDIRNYDLTAVDFDDTEILAFIRRSADRALLVVHNLSSKQKQLPFSKVEGTFSNLLVSTCKGQKIDEDKITVGPFGTMVLANN